MRAINMKRLSRWSIALIVGLGWGGPATSSDFSVVTTIKPIHSIAASIMEGIGTPSLLIKGTDSVHGYQIKPSDAKAIQEATIMVWVGPYLESTLRNSVSNLSKSSVVELGKLNGLLLLPNRESPGRHGYHDDDRYEKRGYYDKHDHDDDHDRYEKHGRYDKHDHDDDHDRYEKHGRYDKHDHDDDHDRYEKHGHYDKHDHDDDHDRHEKHGHYDEHDHDDDHDRYEKHGHYDKHDHDDDHDRYEKHGHYDEHDHDDDHDRYEKHGRYDKHDHDDDHDRYEKHGRYDEHDHDDDHDRHEKHGHYDEHDHDDDHDRYEKHGRYDKHDHDDDHDRYEKHGRYDEHDHDDDHDRHEKHGHYDEHDHDDDHDRHEKHGHHDGHAHGRWDMHIWLDIDNVKTIAIELATVFGNSMPEHKTQFQSNLATLLQRLDSLETEIQERTAPLAGVPYIVFHDAYQYLERRLNLANVAAIAADPEQAPGARTIRELRETVHKTQAVCIFSEPQFNPAILHTIAENTPLRTGVLDPLGAEIEEGPDAYFQLMRDLVDNWRSCLL